MNDNLVPEPRNTVFDSVQKALGDEQAARRVMANPALAKGFPNGRPQQDADAAPAAEHSCQCGKHEDKETADGGIPLTYVDEIGRATAADVREALHQVIDPELGIDVIDLGLVYGIEIDALGRAIITMTLTTPGLPADRPDRGRARPRWPDWWRKFRIDWTWQPRWTMDMITPEGRDQLAALGFNFDAMPKY